MNDTELDVMIFIGNCEDKNFAGKLKPGDGKEYEVPIPEGSIPYIKFWSDGAIVLLSHVMSVQTKSEPK